MTEEEKKAQEAAAAEAAEAQNAGGETGGEAGSQGDNGGEGGEGGEQKQEKTPQEVIFERVRTNRPDAKYDEDEQEIYRQLASMLDEAEEGNGKYKGLTEKLMRRYKDNPEEVAALLAYMEGKPLIEAIVENMGEEALTMKEGDEGYEDYKKAVEKRKSDREGYVKTMEEIKNNMDTSVSAYSEWAKEKGIPEDQLSSVWEAMSADLTKMSRGILDKDIFDRYYKAENYDADVEGAKAQGEANGKNAAIEAKKEQMKGSGLPGMASTTAKKEERELTDREKKAQQLSFLKG